MNYLDNSCVTVRNHRLRVFATMLYIVVVCLGALDGLGQSLPPDLVSPEGVSCQSNKQCAIFELEDVAYLLSFTDGKWAVSGRYKIDRWNSVSLGPDQRLLVGGKVLLEVRPSQPAKTLLRERVRVVSADPSGRISVISDSRLIRLKPDGEISGEHALPGKVYSGALSRDGVVAGVIDESGRLSVWKEGGDDYKEVCSAKTLLYSSSLQANSTWIAIIAKHKFIRLIDTSNCAQTDYDIGVADLESIAIGKTLIAVSTRSGAVHVLEASSGKTRQIRRYSSLPDLAFFPETDDLVVVTPERIEVVSGR